MTASATAATIVALTTQFAPAPSCLRDFYALTTKFFVTDVLGYAQLGPAPNSKCQPSGWSATSQYFSPGICPSGYEVACSTIVGVETQATCCPVSWTCQKSSNWPQYATDACTVNGSDLPSTTLMFTSVNGTKTTTYPVLNTAAGGLNAHGVSIRWKAADFVATPTATTGFSSSKSVATQTHSSTNLAATTSAAASNSNDSSGLSTGAKAGIGIGAAICALLVLGALFMMFKWRQRRNVAPKNEENKPVDYQDSKPGQYEAVHTTSPGQGATPPTYYEVDGTSANRIEADGNPRSELL